MGQKEKMNGRTIGMYLLTLLRVAIGWHFLYEGLIKLFNPNWTAAGYLWNSQGPLAEIFRGIAQNETLLSIVDILNVWGLILVGLGLILGFMTRYVQFGGMALLVLYYSANPPFLWNNSSAFEGQYMFISKDVIEFLALLVLSFFPTGKFLGIDGFMMEVFYKPSHHIDSGQESLTETEVIKEISGINRREVLKHLATIPALGLFGIGIASKLATSAEEANLTDAISSASRKTLNIKSLSELKGELPKGTIKGVEFSKLILGGNLLSGWSHSRDLIYVSSLVKAYHTEEKIFQTFQLAEAAGVNTLLSHPIIVPVINKYWKRNLGKLQFISDCAGLNYDNGIEPKPFDEYVNIVKTAIDGGATACYIQGESADYYIGNGMVDKIVYLMDMIRDNGLPVGIGAHKIETIKRCVDLDLETDFWMKTLHTHDYWSAKHPTWHDNMYCFNPQETIDFMNELPQPWIAFKTLAAGAIKPEEAFPYSFQNGADFICCGMYDFQLVDDVNIAIAALNGTKNRLRPWRA